MTIGTFPAWHVAMRRTAPFPFPGSYCVVLVVRFEGKYSAVARLVRAFDRL